eukprot:SAG22_NODE_4970_length_1120_cov_0.674829_2_plen_87_part_00
MYGLYTTALRLLCVDDRRVSMPLVFGYMGLCNGLLLLPGLLALWGGLGGSGGDGLGGVPGLTALVLGWVVVKGLFDNVLSDYFWAR